MNEPESDQKIEALAKNFNMAKPSVELKESVLSLAKTHWSQSPAQGQLRTLSSYVTGLAAIWLGILMIHSTGYVLNQASPGCVTVQPVRQHEPDPAIEFALPKISPIALCRIEVNPNRSYSHKNQLNTWLNQGVSP